MQKPGAVTYHLSVGPHPTMEKNLIEKYYDLQDGLKSLFKHINALHTENRRLAKENMELRHEVSMLRLYVDTQKEEGGEGLPEIQKRGRIDREGLEFYEALPDEFSFSTLFELSEMLDMDLEKMKSYLRQFLQQRMLRQRGSRIEKTNLHPSALSNFEEEPDLF